MRCTGFGWFVGSLQMSGWPFINGLTFQSEPELIIPIITTLSIVIMSLGNPPKTFALQFIDKKQKILTEAHI
jgi:hypothetical protein